MINNMLAMFGLNLVTFIEVLMGVCFLLVLVAAYIYMCLVEQKSKTLHAQTHAESKGVMDENCKNVTLWFHWTDEFHWGQCGRVDYVNAAVQGGLYYPEGGYPVLCAPLIFDDGPHGNGEIIIRVISFDDYKRNVTGLPILLRLPRTEKNLEFARLLTTAWEDFQAMDNKDDLETIKTLRILIIGHQERYD